MPLEPLAVFLCQLAYVFLLGFQSRNVRDGQFLWAAATSGILGAGGLFMTSIIARSAMLGGDIWLAIAYIAAGPCGICLAMHSHDKLSGRIENHHKPRCKGGEETPSDCFEEPLGYCRSCNTFDAQSHTTKHYHAKSK